MTTNVALRHDLSGGCNSTGVIHNGGQRGHWERTDRCHVRICECGYATPVTTKLTAVSAVRRHICRDPAQLELPYDLPAVVRPAVVHYIDQRRQRTPVEIDGTLVRRFADGEHDLPLNPHERFAVYALLRARGASRQSCTRVLRLSWSTQARYRRLVEAAA